MDNTKIEWCDATWNPLYGCTRVSEGCRNCYAEGLAARFHKPGQWGEGLTRDGRWTGKVTLAGAKLMQPLRWWKPRRIFVNSLSDLFHPNVPDEWIDRVFAVMALCPQHTFIVLTKRPARMRAYLTADGGFGRWGYIEHEAKRIAREDLQMKMGDLAGKTLAHFGGSNLPNVWLGVSISTQADAENFVPDLLATPAAVRIVSAEPLLGLADLTRIKTAIGGNAAEIDALTGDVWYPGNCGESSQTFRADLPRIDGVIVGGESGPHARPMHPDWARSLRDQCAAAGVPFFFKQWGEWGHGFDCVQETRITPDRLLKYFPDLDRTFARVGKTAAGRHIDGKIHDDLPLAKDAAE